MPDGVVLSYPALNLNRKVYTPSYIRALDDQILPHTFLKICVNSYVAPESDPSLDPFLSPSQASDELLSRFPKTRILIGTDDPLHDESF